MESIDIIKQVVPDYPDPDMIEYMAGILDDCEPDEIEESLLEFLEDHAGSEDAAIGLIGKIKSLKLGESHAEQKSKSTSDGPQKLTSSIVLAKGKAEAEAAVQADLNQLRGNVEVNANSEIVVFRDENEPEAQTEEEIIMQAKNRRKKGKLERKAMKRERNAAPKRTAILEALTKTPTRIHGMVGEDGEYGGNPKVDIIMKDFSIDLGGMILLEDCNVTLAYGRKYGLIGKNGSGKSTFLKYMAGKGIPGIPWYIQILHISQEIPGEDRSALQTLLDTDVERAALLKELAILEGNDKEEDEDAKEAHGNLLSEMGVDLISDGDIGVRLGQIYDRLEEIDADLAESKASQILAGLSFTKEMMDSPTSALSGGWRMRVSLAQALFIEPDILMLDEPTNHLDLHAVVWLEEYLRNYENTVVVVSHARDFLNSCCTDVLELQDKSITRYKGNYDTYEETKSQNLQRDSRAKEIADKKREELTKFINKNIGAGAKGATMAKSRMKQLEKMTVYESINSTSSIVKFRIPNPGPVAGGWGIRLVGVGFGYPRKPLLFREVDFSINQNSRICLVGPNGIGKSTLLNLIYQELEPVEGVVTRNQRLRVARFSQHHVDGLTMKRSILEQMQADYPDHPVPKIRAHLGGMGVTGDLQVRPVNTLSGGQKSRIALAMITYSEPHLLLLDEPTNHLDLDTVQGLIKALAEFSGGVFVVSHDEHLITAVCNELWIIHDKKVILSEGDFNNYKKSIVKDFQDKRKD